MKIKQSNNLYPVLLRKIDNPPQILHCRGNVNLLAKTCISFVGTRKNSEYGSILTEKLIAEIAHLDVVIVSGLAEGIDTFAHQAALEYGLPTVAVLGSGIDFIYPRSNLQLAKDILKTGAIISEHPGDSKPRQYHFPLRNRIISGLSLLTVVVEAPQKSGALITAKYALEQGREVATIPADIDRPSSWGNLKLLQEGAAHPVACGDDLISLLKLQPPLFKGATKESLEPQIKLSKTEQKVVSALSAYRGAPLEEIIKKCQMPLQQILVALSMLELYRLVKARGGKYILSRKYSSPCKLPQES